MTKHKIEELVTSWINGNKSYVYSEVQELDELETIAFYDLLRECKEFDSYRRYIIAIN